MNWAVKTDAWHEKQEEFFSSLVELVSLSREHTSEKKERLLSQERKANIDVYHPRFREHVIEAFGERSAEFGPDLLQALFTLWWAGVREGDLLAQ